MDGDIETPNSNNYNLEEHRYVKCREVDPDLNDSNSKEKNISNNEHEDAIKATLEQTKKHVVKRQITSYNLHMFVSEEELKNTLNVSNC